jgi:hypothetical protein
VLTASKSGSATVIRFFAGAALRFLDYNAINVWAVLLPWVIQGASGNTSDFTITGTTPLGGTGAPMSM